MRQFNVTFVYILAEKLIEYAEIDPEKYTEDDYINCISNKEKVVEIIREPSMRFKGPGGQEMAAVMI